MVLPKRLAYFYYSKNNDGMNSSRIVNELHHPSDHVLTFYRALLDLDVPTYLPLISIFNINQLISLTLMGANSFEPDCIPFPIFHIVMEKFC